MRGAPGRRRGAEVIPFPRAGERSLGPVPRRGWRPSLLGTLFGVELLAYGLWIGGMVAIALVAPVVFQIVSSRDLAGRVFGGVLARLFPLIYACAAALLVSGGVRVLRTRRWDALEGGRYGLAAVMLVIALYTGTSVLGEMQSIQASMPGPIETLSVDDPMRVRFNALHKLSERLMGLDMGLGLVLLPLLLRRRTLPEG